MQIVESARTDFAAAQQNAALEDAKAKYIGKNGAITALMRGLAGLTPEQKRERGPAINKAKAQIEALLNARREELADAAMQAKLTAEAVDVTLPGARPTIGHQHLINLSTIESSNSSYDSTKEKTDNNRNDSDNKRHSGSPDYPAQDATSQIISS